MDVSRLAGKRIAVPGGGGFLGSAVVKALRARGAHPVVPRTVDGWDFREAADARRFFDGGRYEIAINCAAHQGGIEYQRLFPADSYIDNLRIGSNLLDAASRSGVGKYIDIVAACSYPGYSDGLLCEEDYWSGQLHESVLSYGMPRKAQVVQAECYRRQFGTAIVSLLLTNLYGPGEEFHPKRSHGLAALLFKIYEARRFGRPSVEIWGSGRPVREWLYVDDAAEAIVAAAERYNQAGPVNVAVGDGMTISALAALIADVAGYEGTFVYDPSKPDGALVKTFSTTRFGEATGWRPKIELREGIRRSLEWLSANYERLVADWEQPSA